MGTKRSRSWWTVLVLGSVAGATLGCSANPGPWDVEPAPGATASRDPNVLERADFPVGASDMEEVLQGRLPGVLVERRGSALSVRIRGEGSVSSSNEALIIIDGVDSPPDALLGMNPRDVQRIEVLKDASAARYGMRGANGVLLITTRRGD